MYSCIALLELWTSSNRLVCNHELLRFKERNKIADRYFDIYSNSLQ